MLNANDFKKKQIIFLFTNAGEKLSFSNDNIVVKDKEGKIKYQSTCYRLFRINTEKQEIWILYLLNEHDIQGV